MPLKKSNINRELPFDVICLIDTFVINFVFNSLNLVECFFIFLVVGVKAD